MSATKKKLKRNLNPRPPRNKRWTAEDPDRWDDQDHARQERIMPVDEGDRRRAVEQAAFETNRARANGPGSRETTPEQQIGVVVAVARDSYEVKLGGRTLRCTIRGSLTAEQSEYTNLVAVGDEVTLIDGEETGVIESVLPRRSALVRPDVFHPHLQQVIAANAHQLLIVSSWREPAIWLELIDRYLISAERFGLQPIICVNKADLVEDDAEFSDMLRPYRQLGYQMVATSAVTGEGVNELRGLLRDRMTILAGLSGTGKSSLAAAVQPGLQLRTAEVNDYSGEGRHTTRQVTMHPLDIGGSMVDTPGIKVFGLSGLRRQELSPFFPEIHDRAVDCRFADCSHLNEPDCAVRATLETGVIAASRYHSYTLIHASLPS